MSIPSALLRSSPRNPSSHLGDSLVTDRDREGAFKEAVRGMKRRAIRDEARDIERETEREVLIEATRRLERRR